MPTSVISTLNVQSLKLFQAQKYHLTQMSTNMILQNLITVSSWKSFIMILSTKLCTFSTHNTEIQEQQRINNTESFPVHRGGSITLFHGPCIMAIPEVMSVGEILKRYQQCLNIFCPNIHHCTTSPLALCVGLCPM